MASEHASQSSAEETRPPLKAQPSPNLACEACRALKIKCYPSDLEVTAKCQRCAKRNEQCIRKIPTRRKQRKRIDTQIKELEKEVVALSTLLKDRSSAESASTARSASAIRPETPHRTDRDDANKIPDELELDCFNRFVRDHNPSFPFITFPVDTHAWDVKRETPILFHAIVATASNPYGEEASRRLNDKIIKILADLVVVEGEQSLELVQSLLLVTAFAFPPTSFNKLKHFHYIQMAAAMLQDLNFSKPWNNTGPFEKTTGMVGFGLDSPDVDTDPASLDCRRALVACYVLSTGISHGLRRTNPLPHNDWIEDCINLFESMGIDNYNDRKLAAIARLGRVVEEFSINVGIYKDEKISYSNPVTQHLVKSYNLKLAQWYDQTDYSIRSGSLAVSFHTIKVYVNEVALYFDHNIEDFQPPYAIAAHKRNTEQAPCPPPPPAYMESIMICITSAQSAIEEFLSMDIPSLRANATMTFVRMMYSIVVLAKLSGSLKASKSVLADKLQIELYMSRLIAHLDQVARDGMCLIAGKFLMALKNMVSWHLANRTDLSRPDGNSNILQPLKRLDMSGLSLQECLKALEIQPNTVSGGLVGNIQPEIAQEEPSTRCYTQDSTATGAEIMAMPADTMVSPAPWEQMDFGVPDFPPMPMQFDANFDFNALVDDFSFGNGYEGFGDLMLQNTEAQGQMYNAPRGQGQFHS